MIAVVCKYGGREAGGTAEIKSSETVGHVGQMPSLISPDLGPTSDLDGIRLVNTQ